MKKVGIYSGTFDPIHVGHLGFAHEAVDQCGLDKVFFLIEPSPRRKQGVKAFEHRVRMVQLAIQDEPRFGSIMLEQQRFTVADTLPALLKRFEGAELCLLIGDDGLSRLGDWPQIERLLKSVILIVGLRRLKKTEAKQHIETVLHTRGLKLRYKMFETPESKISSSNIKRSLKAGHIPSGLPTPVAEYIDSQGLYAAK
jgi:nicotinate-nucleotide adenylyltransferase